MDIDPEYASLVIPTMVICKNFLEIFQAESVWVPGVSLLDGIAYDYGEKKKFIKSVHNFENDILVASKNIAKDILLVKTILKERQILRLQFLTV